MGIGSILILIAAAVGMADAVCLWREYVLQRMLKCGEAFPVEGIKDVLSVAPVANNPRFQQHLHIVRERRLRDVEGLEYLAGAEFSAGEHIHDPQALGIGDRFQNLRGIQINLLHSVHSVT